MTNKKKCFEVEVDGMTCQSCEILLERKLKKIKGVSKVDVDYRRGTAIIDYSKNKPQISQVKAIIEKSGYSVSDKNGKVKNSVSKKKHFMEIGGIFVIVLAVFLLLGNLELFSDIGITENMSFGFIFLIGIVAAFSSCLAVTGGLLVSVTAKYSQMHPNLSGIQRFKPHIYFNTGRVLGYTILGALIGLFGSLITISSTATGILTILASIIMILLGLQLLDIYPKFLNKLKPRMPKALSHKIMKSSEEPKPSTPFLLGAATFFLPCGFTQALQLYVLSKGDPMVGAITMLAFSLGTLPGLLSLGALSSFLKGNGKRYFFKTAGCVVVILGLFTIQNGFVLAGLYPSSGNGGENWNENGNKNGVSEDVLYSSDSKDSSNNVNSIESLDPNVRIENGVQIVEMEIRRYDYYPSQFTILKGMPVEWRIDGKKAAGCAKVITIPKTGLLEYLPTDKIKVIKFTPEEVGDLEFMCTMAMTTRGAAFHVVENEELLNSAKIDVTDEIKEIEEIKDESNSILSSESSTICKPEITDCFSQKLKTEVTYDGFSPNKFEVKVGVPVELEIDAKVRLGGCMSTLVISEFDVVHLIKYGKSVLKFTPTKEGKFPFTCSMGTYFGDFIVTA
ncbi:MAG: sulfite exporter TauE/SafE family protein [Nanoarchaeota archaeon]|nr:sulfite exporter TauE/SafE family protein [Nanoarchaeota archaeon]